MSATINQQAFFKYIQEIAKSNDLEIEMIIDLLSEAFKRVYLRDFNDNKLEVKIDLANNQVLMWRYLKVVDDNYFFNEGDEDDETLISLTKAKELSKKLKIKIDVGQYITSPISISSFDNKIMRSILSVFKQLTTEQKNFQISKRWSKYKEMVFEGIVEKIEYNNNNQVIGAIIVIKNLDGHINKAYLPRGEFIQSIDSLGVKVLEDLRIDGSYLFFIKDVQNSGIEWPIIVSRTNPGIVEYLMKKNISEIEDGYIEIKKISRIAGVKSKVFVFSTKINIDPVGSCIGPRGNRLKLISNQLLNEKIDIILWTNNPIKNVINAMVPAKIIGYQVKDEEKKEILLITNKENHLTAIGKQGNNVKLAYLLSGWRISVCPIHEAKENKINYESVDNLITSSTNKMSDQIYQTHYIKNEVLIKQIDDDNLTFNEEIVEGDDE